MIRLILRNLGPHSTRQKWSFNRALLNANVPAKRRFHCLRHGSMRKFQHALHMETLGHVSSYIGPLLWKRNRSPSYLRWCGKQDFTGVISARPSQNHAQARLLIATATNGMDPATKNENVHAPRNDEWSINELYRCNAVQYMYHTYSIKGDGTSEH